MLGDFTIRDSYADLHARTRKSTIYYWVDPDTGAALYHTELSDEATVPFFADVGSAETHLERQAAAWDRDEYAKHSLYQAKTRKVVDAVDLLTDQSGIGDFLVGED